MHEHWEHKKRRSGGMSNPQIDEWYDLGLENGALGGKLVGAGGGGFLMFYAEDHRRLRAAMATAASKKCGSGSTSKAPRSWSGEPAGRDPGRRPGDAVAADHGNDSQGPRRRRRPAVCRASGAACSGNSGIDASRAGCVGYLGDQIEAVLGDGRRWDMRFEYLLRWAGAARHRRRGAAALPLLGEAFFVMYGDSYLECDFRAVERAFRAQWPIGV